jgi:hypothetical protein
MKFLPILPVNKINATDGYRDRHVNGRGAVDFLGTGDQDPWDQGTGLANGDQ